MAIGYPSFIGIFAPGGSQTSPQTQAQEQQQQNGFGDGFGVSAGALVDGTVCGSPAAAAGMTGGSVIAAVNGTPVASLMT